MEIQMNRPPSFPLRSCNAREKTKVRGGQADRPSYTLADVESPSAPSDDPDEADGWPFDPSDGSDKADGWRPRVRFIGCPTRHGQSVRPIQRTPPGRPKSIRHFHRTADSRPMHCPRPIRRPLMSGLQFVRPPEVHYFLNFFQSIKKVTH